MTCRNILQVGLTILLLCPAASLAAEIDYGGHLKYFYTYSDFPDQSVFDGNDNPYREHLGNLRLKLEARAANWSGEIHYVMDALYSKDLASCQLRGALATGGCDNIGSDARQLFDLSTVSHHGDDALLVQRLDRLWLGYSTDKVVARFGRQSISWGNGMVYNTLDLFNPFAPDAIDTEYKRGDDMLYFQGLFYDGSDLQALLIPRRDTTTGDLEGQESSAAAKMHWLADEYELDLLAARNYGDPVLGGGYTTELGENVVNANISLTDTDNDTVFSAVINYNFSSVIRNRNLSGFIEFFYNGFGLSGRRHSIQDVVNDQDLYSRLTRGELFTTGRYYLAGSILVEMTPLLQLSPILFINLGDSSGMLQFIGTYSLAQNFDLLAGFNLPAGSDGSEFGGLETADEDGRLLTPPNTLFARLAWYF
ncbi:MAG: hypothetical protein ABFS24_10895 [Pseudomonadota bacterium]